MKRFLLFALAVIMFAACSKDAINEQQNMQTIVDEAPETLVVGFEDDETRIQLNDAQKTVWTSGDLVSVFYLSNANQKWQYSGETGSRIAELKRVDAGTATRELDKVVVVYPYNEAYYINPLSYNVKASLPAEQTYLKDSYGLDGNIMISQDEYNQFSLKSVCGWLKLQLTGNGEKVSRITLKGNNNEQVAGELYINSADATAVLAADMGSADDGETGGAGGGLVFDDTILKEVTLNCGNGVELGAETIAFYIALPPQTFDGGITVEIDTTDGATMTKSTDNSIVIERNHIQPMTAFVYDGVRPQPNNEIWYTATAKVEPYKTDEFGATYLSNVWDSETGKGVITFDSDVTRIGDWAFRDCNITSIAIPNSVTRISEKAFYNCYSLTSITIPDGVTSIGEQAFNSCDELSNVIIGDSVTTIDFMAFSYCDNLTSITIGDSVTSIGNYAFAYCTQQRYVFSKSTTPPLLSYNSFENTNIETIYVPTEAIDAYKTASYWRNYTIVGYDFETGEVVEGYGIDDSNLDHNKYLTYVANHSHLLDFESEDYYYWDTYFQHNVNGIMVAEYKFQLAATQNYTIQYISDDSIYIEGNELYVYSESYYNNYDERERRYNTIDLTTIGIQPTDLIVLRVDAANNVVTINDQEISFNKIGAAMSSQYVFSAYDRVSDEGHAYYYDGMIDGAKLYYAKGWDSNGYLTYLGCASTDINDKTGNVEACWRAKYYNGKIVETTTFANDRYVEDYVPLGMGNM